MSEMKPLLDALPFIKFTDRSIGNHFKAALERLNEDMDDEEYTPSDAAVQAYAKLAEEIEDAVENEDVIPPEVEQLSEKELLIESVLEEEEIVEVTEKIDSKDLEEEDD